MGGKNPLTNSFEYVINKKKKRKGNKTNEKDY